MGKIIMRSLNRRYIGITALLAAVSVFLSCTTPVPLYGKWADNRGDTLSFYDDGTFAASINDLVNGVTQVDGDFSILLNSLVFNCSNGSQIVSEWDIRGNILYVNWTSGDGALIPLTLYKVSN